MDDTVSIDELEDTAEASPSRTLELRAKVAGLLHRPRATLGAASRLAGLYINQTRLIFAGSATQGSPGSQLQPSPCTELMTLDTACGQRVAAVFGPAMSPDGAVLPDSVTRPTILFFYGNQGHLSNPNVSHLFHGLRRIGINVMIPEYVGYGLSTGEAGEAGCYASADAAYQHLLHRKDIDTGRIVVAGASLGGAVAIDLASREKVAGLITLITFTSMPDMAKVLQPTLPIWRFIRHKFDSLSKMPRVTCPTLIVHSTGDELIPYTMADRLAATCGGPVSRVKIEGAGHSSVEMLEGGGGLIYDAMTDFFSRV